MDKATRGKFELVGATGLQVDWDLDDGSRLHLRANFGSAPLAAATPPGRVIHAVGTFASGELGSWSGAWALEGG